jgi:pyruvate formate lyase activating enzyme
LVLPSLFQAPLAEEPIYAYLEKRKGVLDAVTVTGGEPTVQPDLLEVIKRIKELGYLVKLDTNGSQPRVLQNLIREGLLDYIAMDIKGPLDRYGEIAGRQVAAENLLESIRLITHCGLAYEFRTTVVESLFHNGDFEAVGKLLKRSRLYVLQHFVPSKTLDPAYRQQAPTCDEYLSKVKVSLEGDIQKVELR